MSILTILEIIASILGSVKDLQAIVDDLRKNGHADGDPLPPEHQAAVTRILSNAWPAELGDSHGPA